MGIIVLILCALVLYGLFMCAKKESRRTGLYKFFGVYGRFKAYITLSFLLAGFSCLLGGGIYFTMGDSVPTAILCLVGAILFFIVTIVICHSTKQNCPDFLKKTVIRDMFLSGFGVGIKLTVFFIVSVWKLFGPQEVLVDGVECYQIGTDIYNKSGELIGHASGANKAVVNKDKLNR